jgi:hypothetical protein
MIYCRANGIAGGPYPVKVYVNGAPTIAPAVFLLNNSTGNGDLIFRDHFDPPGPPMSTMPRGVAAGEFDGPVSD